jgi:hypothetical protein
MSEEVLTDVLVRRGHAWMLRGRRCSTAYTLCRLQDLDVGAALLAHSLGEMARPEELVAWRGLQDRHPSHAGDGQWKREELGTRWLIASLMACISPTPS